MPWLTNTQDYTRAPPRGTRIRKDGLAKGIICATSGNIDSFSGQVIEKDALYIAPRKLGEYLSGFNGSNYATLPNNIKIESSNLTVAFNLYYLSSGANRTYVAQGGSGGGKGWNISSGASANNLRFTLGGVADYVIATAPFSNGNEYFVVVSVHDGVAAGWVNGIKVGSVAVGTMLTPASTSTIIGAAHNGTSYVVPTASGTAIGMVRIWNRGLTDYEVENYNKNQFQIFEPELVPVWRAAAGGVVIPVLQQNMRGNFNQQSGRFING